MITLKISPPPQKKFSKSLFPLYFFFFSSFCHYSSRDTTRPDTTKGRKENYSARENRGERKKKSRSRETVVGERRCVRRGLFVVYHVGNMVTRLSLARCTHCRARGYRSGINRVTGSECARASTNRAFSLTVSISRGLMHLHAYKRRFESRATFDTTFGNIIRNPG